VSVPSRLVLLRWFLSVEDHDDTYALQSGWPLTQRAVRDEIIGPNDHEQFAKAIFKLAEDQLLTFDHLARGTQQFGCDPWQEIQQARDFRSTHQGRQLAAPAATSSPSVSVHGSHIQIAGGDILNQISVIQLIEAAEECVDEITADEEQRAEARRWLARMREGATGALTEAGLSIALQAVLRTLGISL
jgi:hypothetical protein